MMTHLVQRDYQYSAQQIFLQQLTQQCPQSSAQYVQDDYVFTEPLFPDQPYLALYPGNPDSDKHVNFVPLQAAPQQATYLHRGLSPMHSTNLFEVLPQTYSSGRALCIGINYFNQKGAMRGRTDEARSVCNYLQQVQHYDPKSVILLTDDQNGHFSQPNKRNILNALWWLGEYAFQGETIVIYYSGHGEHLATKNGELLKTRKGQDKVESIYPVDFRCFQNGMIKPGELEQFLEPIKRKGAKLTLMLDTHAAMAGKKKPASRP